MPEASYDLITTFDAVHDQARPAAVLKGIAEALKDDGVYLMQDIAGSSHVHNNMDHPIGTYLYTVSTMHCMSVSLAQDGDREEEARGVSVRLRTNENRGMTDLPSFASTTCERWSRRRADSRGCYGPAPRIPVA